MRVTVDSNVVLSAFLWGGNPRRVLNAARSGTIHIFTSPALIAELADVLSRERFEQRLIEVSSSVEKILDEYQGLATVEGFLASIDQFDPTGCTNRNLPSKKSSVVAGGVDDAQYHDLVGIFGVKDQALFKSVNKPIRTSVLFLNLRMLPIFGVSRMS